MNAITIPKKLASGGDLVVVPRREYEALLARPDVTEEFPTKANLRALARMRKNRALGKLLTIDELKRKLAARR